MNKHRHEHGHTKSIDKFCMMGHSNEKYHFRLKEGLLIWMVKPTICIYSMNALNARMLCLLSETPRYCDECLENPIMRLSVTSYYFCACIKTYINLF